MILSDNEIRKYVENKQLIVESYNERNLGGVSYDLTLDKIVGIDNGNSSKEVKKYELLPGEAVFVKSKEMIHMPNDILGRIAQKNSRIRMGLYVDGPHYHPGHKTYVYLRVQNISSNSITIKRDDKIAQIFFEEVKTEPQKLYNSPDDPFAEEIDFKGMSTYSKEYKKHIKKIEKIKQNLDEKETQIYANVLTLMGIISAVFSLITINFEAFANANIDLKFILTFNLSLIFAISVFFGLLYIITNKRKGGSFCFLYVIILILIVVATFLIYRFL